MLKRTALFEEHKKLGGRLIDFGGWELPVQYTGLMDEHLACRNQAGLFDVSHMGEFHVEGPGSLEFLNYLVTNDVSKIVDGQAQYTVLCHENGGIVDDLLIYRRGPEKFLVVVNAGNSDKDWAHTSAVLEKNRSRFPQVKAQNVSDQYTQIALQGRVAQTILSKLTTIPLDGIKTYCFAEGQVLKNIPAVIARTGYTGEDGFEIYVPWQSGPEVWRALLEVGQPLGLKPCGLGARDTLRLEMKYPLYGHELSDETNPLEAGLAWVVKLDKADFVGKAALVTRKKEGMKRKLVGLKMLERGIPRQGYPILTEDRSRKIGIVTSGTQSPCLNQAIAVAYVETEFAEVGKKIAVEIRQTSAAAEIIPTPFYKRPY